MGFFRWIRNDAGAAALAAATYAPVQAVVRVLIVVIFMHGSYSQDLSAAQSALLLVNSLVGNFVFLLLLALGVRWIRPIALGLWIGASGAQLASSMVFRVGSFIFNSMREYTPGYGPSFHIDPWDVVTDLGFAAVFAFSFLGGLALFAPKVLRES